MPTSLELFNTKMDALASAINTKAGTSGDKTIDELKTTVDSIITPTGNINITNTNQTDVTSYATAQVVDANLVAGNIKDGISILGITGTYSGGMPTPSNAVEKSYTVLAGESVAAGDFVQGVTFTSNNALNPAGSLLIDCLNIDQNRYVIAYGSNSTLYIQIVKIENNEIEVGEAITVNAYSSSTAYDDNAYKATLLFLNEAKTYIGLVFYNKNSEDYAYGYLNVYTYSGTTLTSLYTEKTVFKSNRTNDYHTNLIGATMVEDYKLLIVWSNTNSSGLLTQYIYCNIATINVQTGSSDYWSNVIGGSASSLTDSSSNPARAVFTKSGQNIIVAFTDDKNTLYYAVVSVSGTQLTTLNSGKNSTQLSLNVPYLSKPMFMNGYLVVGDAIRASGNSYGKISVFEFDDSTNTYTRTKALTNFIYFAYGQLVQVNSTQFVANVYSSNTSDNLTASNSKLILYTLASDGTITENVKLNLSGSVVYTNATIFALSTNSIYACIGGVNMDYRIANNAFIATSDVAKVYIMKAENTLHELMIAKETKTQGQTCAVYQYRTFYAATLTLSNLTSTNNNVEVPIHGSISFALIADNGYVLPSSITVSGCTSSYDSSTGIVTLSDATGNVSLTASAEAAPAGYTVTIHISGTAEEIAISYATLEVDGSSYYITGQVGSWDTDYPDNDTQITASSVTLTPDSGYVRWKDSNTGTWQSMQYGDASKTWTIPSNGFEIWIDIDMDE